LIALIVFQQFLLPQPKNSFPGIWPPRGSGAQYIRQLHKVTLMVVI